MKERFLARVVSGYRITIPPVVRERLGLSLGDIVDMEISRNSESEKKEE
jgi:bifunctional DNA-binding transcriptional regulator/antitoxin component of YhaV-PrlF toxin-antitoxin module